METLLRKGADGLERVVGRSGVITANRGCKHVLTCPACGRSGVVNPRVVLATVNPNNVPCVCGGFEFLFDWRD